MTEVNRSELDGASEAATEAATAADGVGGGESLLVVDDDPFIARLLEIELRAAGYDVRVAADGALALDAARERCPDLVLADVMMPNMDGFELTRRLRQDPRTATVSVIMLTARGLSADKLEGFAIGADDYIVKPFEFAELVARLRAVARRSARGEPLKISDLTLDPTRRRVERNGKHVELTPKEFDVLIVIAQADGRLVSQKELLARVWQIDFDTDTKQVEVLVHRLRKKLDRTGRVLIDTVYGEGYRLRV